MNPLENEEIDIEEGEDEVQPESGISNVHDNYLTNPDMSEGHVFPEGILNQKIVGWQV